MGVGRFFFFINFLLVVSLFHCAGFSEMVYRCTDGDCSNGKGTFIYQKGTTYTGEWKDGKRHGQGIYTSPGQTYRGSWARDNYNGQGELQADGKIWRGNFIGGQLFGNGEFLYANRGEWKYNTSFKTGKDNRIGEWIPPGKGTPAGYKGWFKDGLFEGHGVFTDVNHARHEGFFRKGRLEGECRIIYSTGRYWKGTCREGLVVEGEYFDPGSNNGASGMEEILRRKEPSIATRFRGNFSDGKIWTGKMEYISYHEFCRTEYRNGNEAGKPECEPLKPAGKKK